MYELDLYIIEPLERNVSPPLSIEECIDQFNTKRPTLVFFGSHETSPIMDIHKPAPAIQSYLRVKR
jgi:hypothetical protein